MILRPQEEGVDKCIEIWVQKLFWGFISCALWCWIFLKLCLKCIVVQGMMKESYDFSCDNNCWTPRGRVWEADTTSQDKNFTEIWVLKLNLFKKRKFGSCELFWNYFIDIKIQLIFLSFPVKLPDFYFILFYLLFFFFGGGGGCSFNFC